MAVLACDSGGDQPAITPNQAVRAPIEGPEPAPPPSRFGYDEHGHLLPAKSLVHGFEVPVGLGEPDAHHEYLEFTIRAPMERIREFYVGQEAVTGKRFSERDYRVDEGRNGFEVWHTDRTLKRLALDDRYREAHIFVTPHWNRVQTLRVHLPRDQTRHRVFLPDLVDEDGPKSNRYLDDPSPAEPTQDSGMGMGAGASLSRGGDSTAGSSEGPSAGRGQPSNLAASKNGSLNDSGEQPERVPGAPGGAGPDGPPLPPPGASPAQLNRPQQGPGERLISPDQVQQATEARGRRYGPYPEHRKRDIRPALREWQKRTPGKTFLD